MGYCTLKEIFDCQILSMGSRLSKVFTKKEERKSILSVWTQLDHKICYVHVLYTLRNKRYCLVITV